MPHTLHFSAGSARPLRHLGKRFGSMLQCRSRWCHSVSFTHFLYSRHLSFSLRPLKSLCSSRWHSTSSCGNIPLLCGVHAYVPPLSRTIFSHGPIDPSSAARNPNEDEGSYSPGEGSSSDNKLLMKNGTRIFKMEQGVIHVSEGQST